MAEFTALPPAEAFRRIDFDRVEIHPSFVEGFILVVYGTKPYLNIDVALMPLVYIRQPEYWGIEVVGMVVGGIGLPTQGPYTATLLEGVVGTEGIEVIGATRSERHRVPSELVPPDDVECRRWAAWHDHPPPGPPKLTITGRCRVPAPGYAIELRQHEPPGINPKDLLLDLFVQAPDGSAAGPGTRVEARYEEETEAEYDTVMIVGHKSVRVQEVT
jgi:hypothetical protein